MRVLPGDAGVAQHARTARAQAISCVEVMMGYLQELENTRQLVYSIPVLSCSGRTFTTWSL